MATAAPEQQLPLFYNSLEPLNAGEHGNMRIRAIEKAPQMGKAHAIPVTVDEFALLQRFYPIVFSTGNSPVPLALMGLNEGVNVFIDDEGKLIEKQLYIPAYMRRYPFLLAKLRPDTDELSLCFDRTAGSIGDFEDGELLFENGEPSEATKAVLQFCEQFETAGQRTGVFMEEIVKSGLLMDGEVAIQPEGSPQPFVYRGFQMVDEEKLRELSADDLKAMNQNGMLALIYAHLFSLSQIREIFFRQVQSGKGPMETSQPQPAEA